MNAAPEVTVEQIDELAWAWVKASFDDPHGDWQSRFSADNMETAYRAGFSVGLGHARKVFMSEGAYAPPAPCKWEFLSADGSWKPCRNANDAAMWAADGFKIREKVLS